MATCPDFVSTSLEPLTDNDLRFLLERFPQPGRDYEEMAAVIERLPTTLESLIESDWVLKRILDRRELVLEISPFLFFSVVLRKAIGRPQGALERKVLNYVANVLSLFVHTDRLYRVQPGDAETKAYIVDLLQEAAESDSRWQFCIYTHIGNYALFLTGLYPQWIEYRHRYKRRPVDRSYYEEQGQIYFHQAAQHRLAREYQLEEVFLRLALDFRRYAQGLNRMADHYFRPGETS